MPGRVAIPAVQTGKLGFDFADAFTVVANLGFDQVLTDASQLDDLGTGDLPMIKLGDVYDNVTVGLQITSKQKLLPLEKEYNFHDFHSPALEDPDFDARPMVMLVGQYSTGKTTFIRYLLEQDFPGIRIGPEPTTDRSGNPVTASQC